MIVRDAAALSVDWLRTLSICGDLVVLEPAQLADLAVRLPTAGRLATALGELGPVRLDAWLATAFDYLPLELKADLRAYRDLHQSLVLHMLFDELSDLPDPEAAASLRAAYDPDTGTLRFGPTT